MKIRSWVNALVVCSVLGGVSGCGVKEYLNCRDLCNKKKQCGSNSSYDVENCVNVCSSNANSSSDYARKVDACQACENGVSCADWGKMAGCLPACPQLP